MRSPPYLREQLALLCFYCELTHLLARTIVYTALTSQSPVPCVLDHETNWQIISPISPLDTRIKSARCPFQVLCTVLAKSLGFPSRKPTRPARTQLDLATT